MAKRKKLNKRVVVFLAILGVVIILAGSAYVIKKFAPRDPEEYLRRARAAVEAKQYVAADEAYKVAISASEQRRPELYMERAEVQFLLAEQSDLPGAERRDRLQQGLKLLRDALYIDAQYMPAQEKLSDIMWQFRGWEEYVQEADKLIELQKARGEEDHEVYLRRAYAKSQLARSLPGRYAEPAMEDYRRAIELAEPEEKTPAWLQLIRFYQQLDRDREAEQAYRSALSQDPNSSRLRTSYGRFLLAQGRNPEALVQIQEAIARDPNSEWGSVALADYYLEIRDFDSALEALQAAREANPADPDVYERLASYYVRFKQIDEAMRALQAGLDALEERYEEIADQEEMSVDRRQLQESRWRLNYLLANLTLEMMERDPQRKEELLPITKRALKQLEQQRLARATGRGAAASRAKVAGRIALAEGDVEEAIRLLEEADQGFGGRDVKTAVLLANLYMGPYPGKAEQLLDRVMGLRMFRENPTMLVAKAGLEARYHNFDEAQKLVNQALEIDPDNEQAKNLDRRLALMQGRMEDVPEGAALLPGEIRLGVSRAMNLWFEDQHEQAIQLLEDLYRRDPGNLHVISRLAGLYLARDRKQDARVLLQEAAERFPDNESIQSQLALLDVTDPEQRLQMRLDITEQLGDPVERAIQKALVYAQEGDEEKYIAQMRVALEADPNAPGAVRRLFIYALGNEDWELAEEMVDKASEANLDGAQGQVFQAELEMAQEDFGAAVAILEPLATRHEGSNRLWTLLGDAYMRREQFEKAAEVYRKVTDRDPTYARAVVGMARVSLALGDMDAHWEWVDKAHRLAPQNALVQRMYLARQETMGEPETVIPRREQMRRANPNDMGNLFKLAQLYQRAGQMDNAQEIYLQMYGNPEFDRLATGSMLVNFYAEIGDRKNGLAVIKQLLEQVDDKVAVHTLGGQFLSQFDASEAEVAFQRAIEIDPDDARPYRSLARLYASQRQWDHAVDAMQKHIARTESDPDLQRQLIAYRIEAGQLDEAGKAADRLLQGDPENPETLILQGAIATQRNELDQALDYFTRAIRVAPDKADAYFHRSRVYRGKGNLAAAKRDLQSARERSPLPQIAMELAAVHEGLGDENAARLVYSQVHQQYPRFEPAVARLLTMHADRENWSAFGDLVRKAQEYWPQKPEYYILESQMWVSRGEEEKSMAALRRALELDPQNIAAVQQLMLRLLALERYDAARQVASRYSDNERIRPWVSILAARAMAQQGQIAEADARFADVMSEGSPEHLQYLLLHAVAAYGPEEAVEKYRSWAAATRGDTWQPLAVLGDWYVSRRNDMEQGHELYLQALELASTPEDKARVNRRLGSTYQAMGQPEKAEQAYLQVLETLSERDLQTLNNLAYLYADVLDEPEKAMPYARRAAGLMPTEPNILDTYGWTLARAGRLGEAETQLIRAITIDPAMVASRYHLGWVKEQQGRLSDAEKQYRQAQALLEDSPDDSMTQKVNKALDRVQRSLRGEE